MISDSDSESMKFVITDNKLQYRFNDSDAPQPSTENDVVYVIYDIPTDRSLWQESLTANSMYYRDVDLNDESSVVALSTCASDYEGARALFAGKLTRIQEIDIH